MLIRRTYSRRLKAHVYGYEFQYRRKKYRGHNFPDREKAKAAAAARLLQLQFADHGIPTEGPKVKFSDFLTRYLKRLGNDTTVKRIRAKHLREFAALLPDGIALEDIKTGHLAQYDAWRLEQNPKLSMRSRLAELQMITAALRDAPILFPVLEGYQPPKKPSSVKSDHTLRERTLTAEELAKLFAALEEPRLKGEPWVAHQGRLAAADLLRLCFLTGRRPGEICSLRREQINFAFHTLTIYATKTSTKDVVKIGSQAEAILRRRLEAHPDSPWLFPSPWVEGKHQTAFYRSIKRACKRARIPYGRDLAGGIVPYTTRHTAATVMLEQGVDPATVSDRLGHRSLSTTLKYTHPTSRSRERAAGVLEAFIETDDQEVTGKSEG